MIIKKLMLLSLTCLYITQMTACQSISTAQTTVSDKITGLFGHNEKLPEIDPKGIVDISKATSSNMSNSVQIYRYLKPT